MHTWRREKEEKSEGGEESLKREEGDEEPPLTVTVVDFRPPTLASHHHFRPTAADQSQSLSKSTSKNQLCRPNTQVSSWIRWSKEISQLSNIQIIKKSFVSLICIYTNIATTNFYESDEDLYLSSLFYYDQVQLYNDYSTNESSYSHSFLFWSSQEHSYNHYWNLH